MEAGYAPVYQNNKGTDLYQWENVPKAVVEGLEGTLNVPVSETVNWTNNITYMLQSKNKKDRRSSVDYPGIHAELYAELAGSR